MNLGPRSQVCLLALGALGVLLASGAAAASLPVSGTAPSDLAVLPQPVPSGGPGPDTPGTSATVSPRSLPPGGTLSFRVNGFPGGETVYVKIDDGEFCAASGVHGACVVHQQRIPASGTVAGSLVLPPDLGPGAHWLRFLASEEIYDDGTFVGIKGYTLHGQSDFAVVTEDAPPAATPAPSAVPSSAPTSAGTLSSGDTDGSQSDGEGPAAVAQAGATLSLAPGPASASTAPTAAAPEPVATPSAVAPATSAAPPAAEPFPIVGVVGLGVLGLLALLVVLRPRRARG